MREELFITAVIYSLVYFQKPSLWMQSRGTTIMPRCRPGYNRTWAHIRLHLTICSILGWIIFLQQPSPATSSMYDVKMSFDHICSCTSSPFSVVSTYYVWHKGSRGNLPDVVALPKINIYSIAASKEWMLSLRFLLEVPHDLGLMLQR